MEQGFVRPAERCTRGPVTARALATYRSELEAASQRCTRAYVATILHLQEPQPTSEDPFRTLSRLRDQHRLLLSCCATLARRPPAWH